MNLPSETKTCGSCGKKMIAAWAGTWMSYVGYGRFWEWWCGCDIREPGGFAEDTRTRKRWEEANSKPEPVATEEHCGNLPGETKPCGECGKKMVWADIFTGKWSDYPKGRHNWVWWCKCQAHETGSFHGYWPNSPDGARALRRWERANSKPEPDPTQPPNCQFCRFYGLAEHGAKFGTCLRHAPVAYPAAAAGDTVLTGRIFPALHRDGWCGDFERVAQEP